jgi:hypothetical protein
MSFFDTLHEGVFLWQVVEDVCATGAGIVSARSYLLDSCLMRRGSNEGRILVLIEKNGAFPSKSYLLVFLGKR